MIEWHSKKDPRENGLDQPGSSNPARLRLLYSNPQDTEVRMKEA